MKKRLLWLSFAPKRLPRSLLLLALLALAAAPIAQTQTPPRPQTPPRDVAAPPAPKIPTGFGFIGGAVTDEQGTRIIANAYVVLIGIGTGIVKVTSTDAEGRYAFSQLPQDRYTVGASKPPYLGAVAGARRPARPGTPIAIVDKQRLTNVIIRLPMGAAISGIITNENGEPAVGVEVAVQRWQMQSGIKTAVNVGQPVATDDRGRYRVFGLQPGEYIVGALARSQPPAVALTAADVDAALRGGAAPKPMGPGSTVEGKPIPPPPFTIAPVYFPGTPRSAEALSIVLASGDERPNADFRLQSVQTSRVIAQIMTSDGQALPGPMQVILRTGAGLMQRGFNVRSTPTGQATFTGIPPGLYTMVATGNGTLAGQFAYANVDVAGADVFGVELVLRPMKSMSGTLVFSGKSPAPSTANRRIPLRALDQGGASNLPPNISATNETGAFTVTNMFPGRYVLGGPLSFGPTPDTIIWTLDTVVADGKDVTDLPIVVTADEAPKQIVVTYTDVHQELTGRIARASGTPVPEHTIVVFPEDSAYWTYGSRRIVTARPGTDGRFIMSGPGLTTLPPGKYLLAAVTDLDRDEQFDPAFLASITSSAIAVTLRPGERKVQDLVVR